MHLSTTFVRDADGQYPGGYSYTKFGNPNRDWLESAVAELEGAHACVSFSTGMSAISAVLSLLLPGDRVLVSTDVFQGTARVLNDQFRRWGVITDVADTCDIDAVRRQLHPNTRMIWVDTPSNPLLRVTDVGAIAGLARSRNILVAVDSTLATFALQRPLTLGADVVVHAATKFIAGHSDVACGLATFARSDELLARVRSFQTNIGATPSPFDCWMVHRSLRTLPLRLAAQCESALKIAHFLNEHPEVETVFYPGLSNCVGHEVAKSQMHGGFGGMLSFTVRRGREAAVRTAANVRVFTRAASLGGIESLIEHRASSPVQTRGVGTGFVVPENLLRLSIGLESPEDLIADLDGALRS